ncbi:MAG: cobalamin-dependent protein [Pseudomonadota bacterium]
MLDHSVTPLKDVVLIGRKLPDNENLGLGYVQAALRDAGFTAEVMILNTWVDMEKICRRVLETSPMLIGLALPDGGSSFLPLGMGELLRRRGYEGHITAGGGFATLARHWLLERYGWLDSVVRFAGEVPAVELAGRLKSGRARPDNVPGLTTRQGDGRAAPVMDRMQVEIFPEHGELPEVIGSPVAHIAATRGCPGRCAYCGPAALQAQERREGIEGGHDMAELRCAGVGGVRRRGVDNLCDEMAKLWHEKKVRYFYFVDEHLLPRNEERALEFLAQWKHGLKQRGVGQLGLGGMLRADLVTPSIAGAFVDTGLVRCFLGIELASKQELTKYGRGGDPLRGLEVMAMFEDLGVAAICNLMLVHPYSTLETIRSGIHFLDKIEKGTFEATQMQVYHGTKLHEKMMGEGRLTGNPLRYSYAYVDEAAERFAQIFSRLRGEAFRNYSISYHVHDIWLAIALAARLDPGMSMDGLRDKSREATDDLNRLRVTAFHGALELAAEGKGFLECSGLVRETRAGVLELQRRIDSISQQLVGRLSRPAKIYSPMKTAAAYALSFCLAGAPMTGCYGSSGKPAADISESTDAPVEEAREVLDVNDAAEEPESCTESEIEALKEKIKETARAVDPCLTVTVVFSSSPEDFDIYGGYDDPMHYCDWEQDRIASRIEEIRSAIAELDLSCLSGTYNVVHILGDESEQKREMMEAVELSCFDYHNNIYEVIVTVDADGRVVDVRQREDYYPVPPEAIDCIRSALEGLEFPCLADYEICPEYLIAE